MPTPIRLTPADARRLQALRAESLVTDPWAFGSAPGDDGFESDDFTRTTLSDPQHAIFAIENPDRGGHSPGGDADGSVPLIAMAGVAHSIRTKQPHIAIIWGVYTTPDARRRGLSRALMNACIAHARTWPGVERIALSVSDRSPNARALYESLGFITWGAEPDCLRINNESAAEHHMSLRL
ncbi:MAG: GNAT family N-acetyltransferase [Phycisphaerales bacterium]|nr:GNAT family N-acetyltransferase [Phycisphaerales bacterium]